MNNKFKKLIQLNFVFGCFSLPNERKGSCASPLIGWAVVPLLLPPFAIEIELELGLGLGLPF
jgi:hypothetical protein